MQATTGHPKCVADRYQTRGLLLRLRGALLMHARRCAVICWMRCARPCVRLTLCFSIMFGGGVGGHAISLKRVAHTLGQGMRHVKLLPLRSGLASRRSTPAASPDTGARTPAASPDTGASWLCVCACVGCTCMQLLRKQGCGMSACLFEV